MGARFDGRSPNKLFCLAEASALSRKILKRNAIVAFSEQNSEKGNVSRNQDLNVKPQSIYLG